MSRILLSVWRCRYRELSYFISNFSRKHTSLENGITKKACQRYLPPCKLFDRCCLKRPDFRCTNIARIFLSFTILSVSRMNFSRGINSRGLESGCADPGALKKDLLRSIPRPSRCRNAYADSRESRYEFRSEHFVSREWCLWPSWQYVDVLLRVDNTS